MRLTRSSADEPGISRVRCGRGFRYLDAADNPVRDTETLDRIRALVLPPAWQDVWICPHPHGHLQATGVDAAGRRQYRYHDEWRRRRDKAKHQRILAFAACLPTLRATAADHLSLRGFPRERVLAGAVRLIDLGFFRVGNESYESAHETYGVATVLREHVQCRRGEVQFEYMAKGSILCEQAVAEEALCSLVKGLRRRKDTGPELLAFREGGQWHDVRAVDVNSYLQELSGGPYTAKDFRTWHATVLAAVGLAVSTHVPDSAAARKRAVARTVREVADYLGNTPAVARRSYIDPRVIRGYQHGITVAAAVGKLGQTVLPGELATIGPFERSVARMLAKVDSGGLTLT
jgi:DNA topoisomerase IB